MKKRLISRFHVVGSLLLVLLVGTSTATNVRGSRNSINNGRGEADNNNNIDKHHQSQLFLTTTNETTTSGSRLKCFDTTDELRIAINQYIDADTYDSTLATQYGWPLGQWCVSLLQDFSNLFCNTNLHHKNSFDEDLSSWDVSKATSMEGMFQNCHHYNNAGNNLNQWNTSRVTTMSRMFTSAREVCLYVKFLLYKNKNATEKRIKNKIFPENCFLANIMSLSFHIYSLMLIFQLGMFQV